MAGYSPFGIAKSHAKSLKKSRPNLKLNQAQELHARRIGFTNFHDFTTVASRNPYDPRLIKAAFGIDDFKDAIHKEPAFGELSLIVEDLMAEDIASTNASGFEIDELDVRGTRYIESTGVLQLAVDFTYVGEQLEDRLLSGTAFYVKANVNLVFRNDQWSLDKASDNPVDIQHSESDQERDWADQEQAREWDELNKRIEAGKGGSSVGYFAVNQQGIYFGLDDRIKLDQARFKGKEFYGMYEVYEHAGLDPLNNYGRPGDEDVAAQFAERHTLHFLFVGDATENPVIIFRDGNDHNEFEVDQDVTTFVNEFTGE